MMVIQERHLTDLERAVEFYPAYSQAHFQMGVIYKSLGMNDEAGQSFSFALAGRTRYKDTRESVPEIYDSQKDRHLDGQILHRKP